MATQQTKDGLGYIIQAISNIVEPKMETLKYDKTYRAKVIQKIDVGVYNVQINGTSYKLSYSGTLNVGDIVRVKAPLNNFSDIYIEPLPGSGGGGTGGTTNYNDLTNKPIINSTYSTAQSTNASEILKGTIALHKISKTGNYNDLLNKPSLNFIPTSQKGVANGVATLGADSIIPKSQLPANTVYDTNYKHIDVEDNLTSSSSDNALSANQGKILASRIEQNDTMITTLQEDIIQAEDNITEIKRDYIPLTQKGVANGVASLDINAKILPIQLPIATTTTLGAFKIGKNLTIDADGTLNATGGGTSSNEVEISNVQPTEDTVELWVDLSENVPEGSNDITTQLLEKVYPVGSIYISANRVSPQVFLGGTWEPFAYGRTLVGVDDSDSSPDMDFAEPLKTGGEKTHKLTIDELASHTHTFTGSAHTHTYAKTNSPTGGPSTNTSGSTVLTTNQIPSHSHILSNGNNNVIAEGEGGDKAYITTTGQGYRKTKIASTGGGQGHTHTLSSHTHTTSTTSTNTGSTTQGGTNSNTGSDTAHNNMQPYITVYMWRRIS